MNNTDNLRHRSTTTSNFRAPRSLTHLFRGRGLGSGWIHHILDNGFDVCIQLIRLCFLAEAFLVLLEDVKDLSRTLNGIPNTPSMIALLDGSIIAEVDAFFEWYLHSGWQNPFLPYWIVRRKITSLERGINEARDLLLSMQARMQLVLRGRAFDAQRWSSSESQSQSDEAQQTRLRVGTDSLSSQAHNGVFHSPHAHLDIHGRIVHLTQIINTGSGTVSGCSLYSTASA